MKTYLGDSVYVTIENGMIKLTTENYGPNADNIIYMEPEVFDSLMMFANENFYNKPTASDSESQASAIMNRESGD